MRFYTKLWSKLHGGWAGRSDPWRLHDDSSRRMMMRLSSNFRHSWLFASGITVPILYLIHHQHLIVHMEEDELASSRTTAGSAEWTIFKNSLRAALRDDQIDASLDERTLRGKSWHSYHKLSSFPDLIVYPESTEDVSAVLAMCNRHRIPVVAFGGGTSLEGLGLR